jgi:hypothetical protein
MRAQAEALMRLADDGDKSGVEAQVGNVLGTCGGCHKPARGRYLSGDGDAYKIGSCQNIRKVMDA